MAQSSNSNVTLSDVANHTSKFFTELSPALLGVWFVVTVIIYVLVFLQFDAIPSNIAWSPLPVFEARSVGTFALFLILAQVLGMLQTALYLPARVIHQGGRDLTAKAVLRMAGGRVMAVFVVSLVLGFLVTAVQMAGFLFDVPTTTWAILPLVYTLAPATWFATAHRESPMEAMSHALEVGRRHWLLIFVVHGALTCMSVALPALVDSTSFGLVVAADTDWVARLGRASIHIGVEFIAFVTTCGLWMAIDEMSD